MSKNKIKIILLIIFIIFNVARFVSLDNGTDWLYSAKDDKMISTIEFFIVTGIGHIVVYFLIINIIGTSMGEKKLSTKVKTEDFIKNIDSSINVEEFKRFAFESFMKLELSTTNHDLETIRKITTDELYNTTKMQLESSNITGNKNTKSNIKYLNSGIVGINFENNIESVNVALMVSYDDLEIENGNKKVKNKIEREFIITFVRTLGTKENKCPNCGSNLDNIASNKCEYCKSVIVSNSYGFVISKNNML